MLKSRYYIDTAKTLTNLKERGYCYLPSIIDLLDDNKLFEEAMKELNGKTYMENSKAHKNIVKLMGLDKLFKELANYANNELKLNIDEKDTYFISRSVKPGQKSEAYRGHFDSHIFTMVLPIQIPEKINKKSNGSRGELKAFPNSRRFPKNELTNFIGKFVWKRHSNADGFKKLETNKLCITEYFDDYRPLIFMGRTTFHGNNFVDETAGHRLTFLCHLYDPSPKFGIGSILRLIRNR